MRKSTRERKNRLKLTAAAVVVSLCTNLVDCNAMRAYFALHYCSSFGVDSSSRCALQLFGN